MTRPRAALGLAAAATIVGCATAPLPVTKIVNGRVVVTRAVGPDAYEHVARALLYEQEERWLEAAEELQRALPFDPDAAEVRAELAELFVRLGRFDDAADEIAQSLATAPTVEGYLADAHLAEARAGEKDAAKAIAALRHAADLALAGDDVEAIERTHLELAEAQLGALDLTAALDTVRRLVRASPETQRGRVQLAALAWPTGALDEAIATVSKALDEEPGDVEARLLLGELQIATNQIAPAKASFLDAIDRADAPLEIADAFAGWLVLRGDVAEAQALADRLTADAADVDALALASGLERTVKRADRALALARRAEALGAPAGRVALLVGAALGAGDDQDGALKTFLGVATDDDNFFESRLRAAALERDRGKLDEAARLLDAAAAAASDDDRAVELAIARSQVDEKRGDEARAARRLDEALAARVGEARFDERLVLARAGVDDRRGDWRRALARVGELLARHPRDVEALNFAGYVAADHGQDLALATRRLQAAVALSPGTGGIVDSLGWACFRGGDLAGAGTYLEQAGRLEPGDAEIMSHLGDLYARRQERERALAIYRRALTRSPSERVARDLGERIRTLEAKSAAGR